MSEVHVNTLITEFEDAYKKAMGAVDEFYQKGKALRDRYEGDIKKLTPEVEADVKAAEAEASQLETKPKGRPKASATT